MTHNPIRDHYLPPDREAFRRSEPESGRIIVIAPTRAACETIELAMGLRIETVLEREHGAEIRELARSGRGFGIMAGTGTGKTLAIRPMAEEIVRAPLAVGVVNREREATPETPSWNVVIVTTGIARRWFQANLIDRRDTLVVDEIHQTSAELELCLALGKRVGCRFIWLSATVDPSFYARYLESAEVLETSAFDPALAARVTTRRLKPAEFLDDHFLRHVVRGRRGVAVFLPTRAEVEQLAESLGDRWQRLTAAFYHGGEPIRVIRPFLEGTADKPFLLAMTAAGQSALNIPGLDTVVIYDARYANIVEHGRNVLTRQYLGANEILQMAGRVHGRVQRGEVYILTDRDVEFEALTPVPPEFQLAGDTERVAMTAAALGVDLSELELPVPLDRHAYRDAVWLLERRGLVEDGRLTAYGQDVEAMPVERPWGELLVHADESLIPFVAVAANVESLHRMTREERDLRGLVVSGSDHLTAYNVYAEAVNAYGTVGQVYGLPRHLFMEEMAEWAARRGVLVKAIEDLALGTASVYRSLELPLPARLPRADQAIVRQFRELLARVAPLDVALDGSLATGEPVRVSKGSMCSEWGAITGTVRYFADRFGVPRAAIEGTNVPLELVRRYARSGTPAVSVRDGRAAGLVVERHTEYAGFVLDQQRERLRGRFPDALAARARDALAKGVLARQTPHHDQGAVARAADRLDEYWRRSGGKEPEAAPRAVYERVRRQLESVSSWEEFLKTPLILPLDAIPDGRRRALDALPASVHVLGDRVAVWYDVEDDRGVAWVRLREGQARRLRSGDVPELDRPVRLAVLRGRREVARAKSLDEMRAVLRALPREAKRRRR
jgi:hypothetical protein